MLEWIRNRRYPLVLAVICAAVLSLGILLKPAKQQEEARISPADMERLQRRTVRKRLDDLASHFQYVGNEVSTYLVSLGNSAATGVIWNNQGWVLAAKPSSPLQDPINIATSKGETSPAAVVWRSREIPLIALKSPLGTVPPPMASPSELVPGAWLLVVAQRRDRPPFVVPAVYSGHRQAGCGLWDPQELQVNSPLPDDVLGAGVFTLDNVLAGMVIRCRQRLLIASVDDLQAALKTADSAGARVIDEFGLRLSPLDNSLKEHFSTGSGVLISEVWEDSAAANAGLAPGDIVIAIGGKPVSDEAAAEQALLAGYEGDIPLKLMRFGRAIDAKLPTHPAASDDDYAGITISREPAGVPVGDIKPNSPAESAGLRPGDVLLTIDGHILNPGSRYLALLQDDKGAFVVFRRDHRRIGVLLP